jgi:hypothetical protein
VATAEEDRLSFRRNPHHIFCGSQRLPNNRGFTERYCRARGRRGFKKLEAANLGPRRPGSSLKLARK